MDRKAIDNEKGPSWVIFSNNRQLQLELRQLQQTLIIKQDELTQLNRDNARLLAEARQLQKEQHAQQQLLAQKVQALEAAQRVQM